MIIFYFPPGMMSITGGNGPMDAEGGWTKEPHWHPPVYDNEPALLNPFLNSYLKGNVSCGS